MELRNKNIKSRQDTYEKSLLVQVQLSQWVNKVYDATEQEPCDEDGPFDPQRKNMGEAKPAISPPHKILLLIQQHESTINLNRPLLVSGQETPASQAALQVCISASKSIIDATSKSRVVDSSPEDNSSLRAVLVWPHLTWSVWMSCFILSYAALERVTTVASAHR